MRDLLRSNEYLLEEWEYIIKKIIDMEDILVAFILMACLIALSFVLYAVLFLIAFFQLIFRKKDNKSKYIKNDETVTDIDGNVYHTIKIGTQVWMAENLKTTKYNNGDLIGTTTPATLDISDQNTPKYQWAYGGNDSNIATYGRLYTWHTITDIRGICPTGWHVPNDEELKILISNSKFISISKNEVRNTRESDEIGIKLLQSGTRHYDGTFNGIRVLGHYWSSTESAIGSVEREMDELYAGSLRCIKDINENINRSY